MPSFLTRLKITVRAIRELLQVIWVSSWAKDPGALYIKGITATQYREMYRQEAANELQEMLQKMGDHAESLKAKRSRRMRS